VYPTAVVGGQRCGGSGVSAADPVALATIVTEPEWTGPPSLLLARCLPRREGSLGDCLRRLSVPGEPLRGGGSRWHDRDGPGADGSTLTAVDRSTSLWTDPLLRRQSRSTSTIVRVVLSAAGAADSLGSGFPRRLILGECVPGGPLWGPRLQRSRRTWRGRVHPHCLWTGPPLCGLIHFFED
jgi:hypothetical protein